MSGEIKEGFIGFKRNKPFFYPLENLKKHFIALGSSGSGKTVLTKILIEESALQHIPSIVIDIQGDLSSLAIRGSISDLEAHNLDREVIDRWNKEVAVTIFTPLSSKGVSICINPLEIPNSNISREELIPMLHEISTAISKLLGYSFHSDKGKFSSSIIYSVLEYSLEMKKPLKTFSRLISLLKNPPEKIARIIEELNGSEKELDGLIRKIKFLDIGEKKLLFQFGLSLNIDVLLGRKVDNEKTHISVIYLNTLTSQSEKEFFIATLANRLYQWMLAHPSEKLQANLVIDEIAPFIPAGSEKPISKPPLKLLFKQARKYGISCLIATQNPGDIDYKAFAQFGTWAIGRLTVKQDIKKVSQALKSVSSNNIIDKLPRLKTGSFIMFAPDISNKLISFKTRWLYTKHLTLTEEDIKHLMSSRKKIFEPLFVQSVLEKASEKLISTKTELKGVNKSKHLIKEKFLDSDNSSEKKLFFRSYKLDDIRRESSKFKKHLFWKLGPSEEHIIDIKVQNRPYILSKVKVEERFLFGLFKTRKIYDLIFDGTNNNIVVLKKDRFKEFLDSNKLFSLTENELFIFRFISQNNSYTTEEELVLRTGFSKQAVKSHLSNLLKKKLISFEKVGRFKRWFSALSFDKKFIFKISSKPDIILRKAEGSVQKARLDSEKIDSFVRLWFDSAVVLNSEIVYAPIYEISFSKGRNLRKIFVNGINKKIIDN